MGYLGRKLFPADSEREAGDRSADGGSICNDIFTEILGMPTLWVPHSYPSCSQHAPDEHILMSVSRNALELMAGLYWDLGESGNLPRR